MENEVSVDSPEALSKISSREAILHSAFEVFASKGVAGARVDEIVDKAGLNVRMIYHHFGSKEGLYDEVLRLLVQERNRECWAEEDEVAPPEDHLVRLAQYSLRVPHFSKIMRWERASSCRTLAATVSPEEYLPPQVRRSLMGRMKAPSMINSLWIMVNATGGHCLENPWEPQAASSRQQELLDQYLAVLRIS